MQIEIKDTLFVSDLDGTLLNDIAEVSDFSVKVINRLIDAGMNFTVATARTAATVVDIMKNVKINLPVVLMNGACIYDIQKEEYIHFEKIDGAIIEDISYILESKGVSAFGYGITEGKILNYRGPKLSKEANEFYVDRVNKYKKVFKKVQSLSDIAYDNIIYLSIIANKKVIEPIYEKLCEIEGINIVRYCDTYDTKTWYVEVFSNKASKYHATMYIKEKHNFKKIIGFGDNLNDIPLFAACDVCLAPINAHEEIKRAANEIIDSNENDGVAKWLLKIFSKTIDFNEII